MKKTFVIISISNRVDDLNELMETIIASPYDDFDVNLMFQDPDGVFEKIKYKERYTNIFVHPELLGCHGARVILLQKMPRYDVYINLDDDILLTEHTKYEGAIKKACERSTGFVLTNWAKSRKLMDAKVPKMREEFKKQALVYQGGGMVYTEKIASLMRDLKPIKATFDTEWPLTAYLNGFSNYRYLGSLAVHKICSTGGMHTFLKSHPAMTALNRYVNYRKAKRDDGTGMSLCIPLDKDLKPSAHLMHKEMKRKRNL
jgi:hypothetical protein